MRRVSFGRAIVVAVVALSGCTADGGGLGHAGKDGGVSAAPKPKTTDVTSKDWEGPPLPHAKIILTDAFGARHVVDAEVAATEPMRERGLMWRTSLEDGKGMIFLFKVDEVHNFWMRNTLIPLDMLFLAADGTVVGVVKDAEPKTLTSRTVGKPSRYVLEVPGGWCEKNSIDAGAKAQFQGLQLITIE